MKRLLMLLVLLVLPTHVHGGVQLELSDVENQMLCAPTCGFCEKCQTLTHGHIPAMHIHAHLCGNEKLGAAMLVKGFWGTLWAANAYIVYRMYKDLNASNNFRTTVTTRGLSDLIGADLSKLQSSTAIKVIAGALASATVAYALYAELVQLYTEEVAQQETDA